MPWDAVKKIFPPRISCIFLRLMRWIAVNYLFSPRSWYSYKKIPPYTCPNLVPTVCLQLLVPLRQLSLTSMIILVNLRKRWKTNAVNFCKKCGEMGLFFFHRAHCIHRFSYIICQRVDVANFCKKWGEFCGEFLQEMRSNAVKYSFSPHSPQSLHFLQKFTQKSLETILNQENVQYNV